MNDETSSNGAPSTALSAPPVPAPALHPITKKPWTDEQRKAQSERAKRLVAEGKIGGRSHGRRKYKPAYAIMAATAAANGKKLADQLLEIALHGQTQKLRMEATKMLLDVEQRAQQERRDEEDHLLKLSRDELIAKFFNRLQELTGLDANDLQVDPDVINGTAVDLDEGDASDGNDDEDGREEGEEDEEDDYVGD